MNKNFAIKILLCLIGAVTIFHLCILVKVIPYEITWGGRLKNDNEMYMFESISIFINLFFAFILLMKGEIIKSFIPLKIVNVILWVFLVLFCLNTVGNLFAETTFEKSLTLLTLANAILIWVVLRKDKD